MKELILGNGLVESVGEAILRALCILTQIRLSKLAVIRHVLGLDRVRQGRGCRVIVGTDLSLLSPETLGTAIIDEAIPLIEDVVDKEAASELAQSVIEDVVEVLTGVRYPYWVITAYVSQEGCRDASLLERHSRDAAVEMRSVVRALTMLGSNKLRESLNKCLREAMKAIADKTLGEDALVAVTLEDLGKAVGRGSGPILYNDVNEELRSVAEILKDMTAAPLIPLSSASDHTSERDQGILPSTVPALIYKGLVELGEKLGEAPALVIRENGITVCGRRCINLEEIRRIIESLSMSGLGWVLVKEKALRIGALAYYLVC